MAAALEVVVGGEASVGVDVTGVADSLGELESVLGAVPEPPGHMVRVKSEFSLQTVVRTSSGALYAAWQTASPAGQSTTWQVGLLASPIIEGTRVIPASAKGDPSMLERS